MAEMTVEEAQEKFNAASFAHGMASGDYETALQMGDDLRSAKGEVVLSRTSLAYVLALGELVRARRAACPSWELLLSDPTMQLDPKSEILASIAAYNAALPATAGLPVKRWSDNG